MPSKLVLCARNAIDFGTITASPAVVATLPASHLQLPARGRIVKTTSASTQQFNVTWGGQTWHLNFLTLARHNLEAGQMWRVQVYSDPSWTTQIYDSGTVLAFDALTLGELDFGTDPLGKGIFTSFLGQKYSLVYFNRVLAGSVRVTISGANSGGCYTASRLFAGDYMEFLWNPEAAEFGWDEATSQDRTLGGTLRSDGTFAFRALDLQLAVKDQVQRAQLTDMWRYAGLRGDLFLSLFPGAGGELERDYTMLAKFVGKMPKFAQSSGSDILKTRLSLQEV